MKKIALLLSLLLYAGLNSCLAQIRQGDLLINRREYERLKGELAVNQYKAGILDSLEEAYTLLFRQNERVLNESLERLSSSEMKIISLQEENQKLRLMFNDQKKKTREYRYAYTHAGMFKERAQVATVWAALMSVSFLISMNENPAHALIASGSSALLTIYLAGRVDRTARKVKSL